ncbi:MAG: ATP-binding protein, partial [Chthoniobacteraceae bacterium]
MKTARSTFRLRLAIHTMLVAGVLVAAFGAGAWWYAQRQLARNLDLRVAESARRLWTQLTPRHGAAEMREAATAIFGTATLDDGRTAVLVQSHVAGNPVIYSSAADPAAGFRDRLASGEGVITTPDDSRPLERTPPAQRGTLLRPQMPEIREPVFFTTSTPKGEWRYVALSSPRYTVFVGLSTREFYAEVRRAAWSFAAAGAAGLLLAGLGAWWLAGRAMRPLERVVATAEKLSAAELDERIPIKSGDDLEFARLIFALNGMIERLHASFQQAARFTADASHELKTPLAVMQAALHDALRSGQPPPVEALLGEVSRLKSITQSLLLLSQADAGKLPLQRERYDLSIEVAGIAEDAEALCAEAGLKCEHSIAPGIEVEADRALMRHVFRNLLANAIQYNRPGGSVTMSLRREDARAIFSITNTGPGIPAEVQPRLFERFFRADHARQGEGTG